MEVGQQMIKIMKPINIQRLWMSGVESYSKFIRENNIEENPLLQSPGENSPNHILNALNDDCLYVIFKKSTLLSLCSIANVCVRFSKIAQQVFASKYKHKTIGCSDLRWNCSINPLHIVTLLYKFGTFIESLVIHRRFFDFERYKNVSYCSNFLKMINKYCPNLTSLNTN